MVSWRSGVAVSKAADHSIGKKAQTKGRIARTEAAKAGRAARKAAAANAAQQAAAVPQVVAVQLTAAALQGAAVQ